MLPVEVQLMICTVILMIKQSFILQASVYENAKHIELDYYFIDDAVLSLSMINLQYNFS